MDLLADLFRDAGLRRRLLDVRPLGDGHPLRFPCDRSVGFHVVLDGTLYIHGPGLVAPLTLRAGDIAVMGRGTDHLLATTAARPRGEPVLAAHWAGDPPSAVAARVVSGAYQLWHAPIHPLLTALPPWFVLEADRPSVQRPIGLLVSLLADEAASHAVGRDTVMHALLDALFAHLMRELLARGAAEVPRGTGWADEPTVRQALSLLHGDVARNWTLAELAREAGASRSALAERFHAAVGEPPLAYLRTVRVQRAMRRLIETSDGLEAVAHAVGYGDAFSFSKAFKRVVGMSPGEFRRQDLAEQQQPWRFGAESSVAGPL